MKKILFFVLQLLCLHTIFAQNYTVSGAVVDSLTQKNIVFVTVALYSEKDTAKNPLPINGVLTEDNGKFSFENLSPGMYTIETAMLGYANHKMTHIEVKNASVDVGKIAIRAVETASEVVEITGLRAIVENKVDKIIYNVESDPMAQSGNVLEVMKKVPYVTVTADDKIMVKGQTSFKVLLNGKNTGIISKNPSEALKAFPANSIKKIEVITEPGAKYDAEGASAVINIITKKEISGYNGGFYGNFNTLGRGNFGGYINVKQNKLGISSYLGMYNWNTPGQSSFDTRQSLDPSNLYTQTSQGKSLYNGYGGYGNVELAYDIDSLKAISMYVSANPGRNSSTSESQMRQVNEYNVTQRYLDSYGSNLGKDWNVSLGTDYIQKFGNTESEHEWTVSALLEKGNSHNFYENKNYQFPQASKFIQNTNAENNSEYTFSTDYVLPFKKIHRFGTGLKAIQRNMSSDYRNNVFDSTAMAYIEVPSQTNQFSYHQTILSAYSEYNLEIKKWTIKPGLRYEHTLVNGDFPSANQIIKNQYGNLLPSLMIAYKPKPTNMLKISYNKRIERPSIWYLNPFVNNSDLLAISQGNPLLEAERTHNVGLHYNQFGNFGNINISLEESILQRNIDSYIAFNPSNGTSFTTYYNMGGGYRTGLDINGSLMPDKKKKINIYIYAGVAYNVIFSRFDNYNYKNQGFSGNMYSNFSYQLPKNFFVNANGNYWSGGVNLQGRDGQWYEYGVGMGKSFFKKKLSFTLQVQNPHAKFRKSVSTSKSPTFIYISDSKQFGRALRFSLNYRFGSLQESVSRKKGISNDDKKSGGGGNGGK